MIASFFSLVASRNKSACPLQTPSLFQILRKPSSASISSRIALLCLTFGIFSFSDNASGGGVFGKMLPKKKTPVHTTGGGASRAASTATDASSSGNTIATGAPPAGSQTADALEDIADAATPVIKHQSSRGSHRSRRASGGGGIVLAQRRSSGGDTATLADVFRAGEEAAEAARLAGEAAEAARLAGGTPRSGSRLGSRSRTSSSDSRAEGSVRGRSGRLSRARRSASRSTSPGSTRSREPRHATASDADATAPSALAAAPGSRSDAEGALATRRVTVDTGGVSISGPVPAGHTSSMASRSAVASRRRGSAPAAAASYLEQLQAASDALGGLIDASRANKGLAMTGDVAPTAGHFERMEAVRRGYRRGSLSPGGSFAGTPITPSRASNRRRTSYGRGKIGIQEQRFWGPHGDPLRRQGGLLFQ